MPRIGAVGIIARKQALGVRQTTLTANSPEIACVPMEDGRPFL
jgi:hypothetical protein